MIATVLWHPGEQSGVFGALEGRLLDARVTLRGPLPPPEGVAVILIDDTDLAQIGQFPPPRSALASAINAARAQGASTVVLDLLLVDPTPRDHALQAALARPGPIVLATARGGPPGMDDMLADAIDRSAVAASVSATSGVLEMPIGPLLIFAASSTLGHVNLSLEPDGKLRRLPAALPFVGGEGGVWIPGLALASLRAADPERFTPIVLRGARAGGTVSLGQTTVQLDRFGSLPLVFYGKTGTIPTWPLRDLDQAKLEDRVLFLGVSVQGAPDRYPTPFDPAMPGVEAHATLAANLIEGRTLRRDNLAWAFGGMLALVVASVAYIAARQRAGVALPALTALALTTCVALQAALLAGWWLDATTVLICFTLAAGLGISVQAVTHARHARNLAKYQAPSLREALAESDASALAGRRMNAVAVFVDLAGFTGRSEEIGPQGTGDLLDHFHQRIARLAALHGGLVDQIVGDAALVTFGLPEPAPGDAAAALSFAADLMQTRDDPAPSLRLGAHYGPIEVRALGGAGHSHVTMVGDAVNAASRLQEVAKGAAARIAISDTLLQQSGTPVRWIGQLALRDHGPVELRGRKLRLHVWVS